MEKALLGDQEAIKEFYLNVPEEVFELVKQQRENPTLISEENEKLLGHSPLYKAGKAFMMLSNCLMQPGVGFLVVYIIKYIDTQKGLPLMIKIVATFAWSVFAYLGFSNTYPVCRDFVLYLLSIL